MPVRDPFSYSARWDSAGVDCSTCKYFIGPKTWPDVKGVSRCKKHDLMLTIELAASGYKEGEWFCRDFADSGRSFKPAVAELASAQEQLVSGILYRAYGDNGFLQEQTFEAARHYAAQQGIQPDGPASGGSAS